MNVLVIPSWYPNGTDKLMGIYHKEFTEALIKNNISANMLYIDRQRLNAPFKYLFMKKHELIHEEHYDVHITKMLDIHKISFNLEIKKYTRVLEASFLKYLKNNPKPDIIHAMVTIPAGYAACVIGKKYNIPVVVTEHASYFKRFFTGKNKKYGEYVLENSYFSTVSNYMAEEIKEISNIKCDVLPNLVETADFKAERKKIKDLKLITVAALRQGKRVDDIFEALKIITENYHAKNVSLTVIGDGFLEDYYKRRCSELNMDKYVSFVGRKNKYEIAELLKSHNLYVISSDKETFCISGIEALASGIPIVSTKCLGPEEYINEEVGKLIEVGNPEDMAKSIMEVYPNMDNYQISKLREVADQYSSKNIIKKATKIYKSLLK